MYLKFRNTMPCSLQIATRLILVDLMLFDTPLASPAPTAGYIHKQHKNCNWQLLHESFALSEATRRRSQRRRQHQGKCEQAGGLGRAGQSRARLGAALAGEGGVVSVFSLLFCSRAHSLFHLRIVLIILELYRVFVFLF